MKTINKIISKVDCKYGAPLGRSNIIPQDYSIVDVGAPHKFLGFPKDLKLHTKRIFDCAVPMSDAAYDKGGVYWGLGKQLRVQYTKDLTYVKFYRVGDL